MDVKDMEMDIDTGRESSANTTCSSTGPTTHNYQNQLLLQQQPVQAFGENVMDLLVQARHLISQRKPSLALQAVVMAVKTEGGDSAVYQTMQRARDMYMSRLHAIGAADELASLFAECAIAEAHPLTSTETRGNYAREDSSVVSRIHEASILSESGRKHIVLDAYLDGSSFICLQCGGLVSNLRRDEHLAYWCSAAGDQI